MQKKLDFLRYMNNLYPEIMSVFKADYQESAISITVLAKDDVITFDVVALEDKTLSLYELEFLAYLDSQENLHSGGKFSLLTDHSIFGECLFLFKTHHVYEILVHPHLTKADCFLLKEVIKVEPIIESPQLEQIRQADIYPNEITLPKLGMMTFSNLGYNGKIQVNQIEVDIGIHLDVPSKQITDKLANRLTTFIKDIENWDIKAKNFAVQDLFEMALDWQEEDSLPLTQKSFKQRIELISIDIYRNNEIEMIYSDDEIFAGHLIFISIRNDEIYEASIQG